MTTRIDEISPDIYRISTAIPPDVMPGGFTFNQFLLVDEAPLLFHSGPRSMFPLVRGAVERVLGDVARLRYVAFSHIESDECGSMDSWLAAAPECEPVGSTIAGMTSGDLFNRPIKVMADGAEISLGKKKVRWLDAPHLPHNWECGYMFESTTKTLLCGDLFTHGGHELPALTESEVLSPSEALRAAMGGVAIERDNRKILEKLARTEPQTLALMHGSSYRGDCSKLLLGLADALAAW